MTFTLSLAAFLLAIKLLECRKFVKVVLSNLRAIFIAIIMNNSFSTLQLNGQLNPLTYSENYT